jgi:hypothetical protein
MQPENMWIRWTRIRNTDSHLKKWGGGHCQLGEAVQEVVGETERGEAAQKYLDPVDPIRIRNTDSHLKKRRGGHCQMGEAVQEVVGEAE